MPSHHYEALVGVQTVLQSLGLSGIPGGNILLRKLPFDRNLPSLPCVLVSLWPIPELLDGTQNSSEDYGYPCGVTLVAASNQDLQLVEGELLWRQQIRNAFHNRRPAALAAALSVPLKYCRWEPAPVLDLPLFRDANLFVSPALIRVFTREARPA
jgi:hypothetical protein